MNCKRCGKPITKHSKSGMCQPCAARAQNAKRDYSPSQRKWARQRSYHSKAPVTLAEKA